MGRFFTRQHVIQQTLIFTQKILFLRSSGGLIIIGNNIVIGIHFDFIIEY